MKQRCSTHHMHFIQTMHHGSVKKIPNVCKGKSALVFRDLKDILRKRNNHDRSSDAIIDCVAKEKTECIPLAERKSKAYDHNKVNYTPKEDQDCDSDDPNNVTQTLKQLKERYQKKKRKAPCTIYLVPKEEHNESQDGEDNEFEESLSILKSKLSKNRKGKRKWRNQSVSDMHSLVSIKSEETTSEMDYHLGGEDHILQQCFTGDDTDKEFTLTELEYQGWVLSLDYLQTCNEVSSDAFDYVEPLFVLPPSIGENTDLVELCETRPQLYLLPAPEVVDKESYDVYHVGHESFSNDRTSLEDQSVDMFNKFHNDGFSGQIDEISGDQVQDMFFDTKYDAAQTEDNNGICILNGSTLGTKANSIEYSESVLFSTEITPVIAYKLPEDPELSMEANAERIHPKPENSPTILLIVADDEQSLCSPSADTEKNYLEENHQLGSPFELSPPRMKASCISEMDHPPERLFSSRKVISPASQEKLRKAMKGIELTEELDQYSQYSYSQIHGFSC